jgi:hypothetical protein
MYLSNKIICSFFSLIKQNSEYMVEDQTIVGTNNSYFTSKSQTIIWNMVTESLKLKNVGQLVNRPKYFKKNSW